MTGLIKDPTKDLPFNIDNRYSKWYSENELKEKYECRWVVLTEQANEFIIGLAPDYQGLALSNIARDDRGPLTIITASYGEAGWDEDGELTWWTLSNGIYTYHIRRRVKNDADSIHQFCEHCKHDYGYEEEEVSVNCSPTFGEEYIYCEGTFTESQEEEPEWGTDPETGAENDMVEEEESINFTSSLTQVPIPIWSYLEKVLGETHPWDVSNFQEEVDSGKYIWRDEGDFGNGIQVAGWYETNDTNPQAWNNPATRTWKKEQVDKCRQAKKQIPNIPIIVLKASIRTKVTSKEKLSLNKLSSRGSGSIPSALAIPEELKSVTWGGHTYELNTKWVKEGTNFDGTASKKHKTIKQSSKPSGSGNSTSGREDGIFYTGTITDSYITMTTFVPPTCSSDSGVTQ